jgi:hypothetical protein
MPCYVLALQLLMCVWHACLPACLPAGMHTLQWFLKYDSQGKERPAPWSSDLLSTAGQAAPCDCLEWLQEGAPGYKRESNAGRPRKEVLVSAVLWCDDVVMPLLTTLGRQTTVAMAGDHC